MKPFKSYFAYNKRQRNGLLVLLVLVVTLQWSVYYLDFSPPISDPFSVAAMTAFQEEYDSLSNIQDTKVTRKLYRFNPNFITDERGYRLGMSLEEIDRLLAFRKTGMFVNSEEAFQQVTGISDSLLAVLSPQFRFPDWVLSNNRSAAAPPKKSNPPVVRDINQASVDDLKTVDGVGEKLAARIVKYRAKLQGFSLDEQLLEVWYLDPKLATRILRYFKVKQAPVIDKINVNEASFKELLAVVYIDYKLTKKILEYREEVAEIQSLEALKKIKGFPRDKFDRIALYLEAK